MIQGRDRIWDLKEGSYKRATQISMLFCFVLWVFGTVQYFDSGDIDIGSYW